MTDVPSPTPTLDRLRLPLADLLAGYEVPPGHFDELRTNNGALRPDWQAFAKHTAWNADALASAEARVAQQIHENGVTYNVYADPGGASRPWGLDVLPLLVPAAEWETLAQGLRQRARLLNALMADLYGPQQLLHDGSLPAALVLGHPGFLRPCHGIVPPGGCFLHQVAFDLARGSDGRWRIVETRCQAPSGAGYALENRITISRLFPDAFREMHVHMLASFFRTLQETLLACSPSAADAPHIVLLTPGPYNETYFEHAYLARYLGFTLAEGSDLTVRDDRVYLKTVNGLERVHGILRRLDDDFCDPVELRADSALGIPGLVQAWRAGGVLVANALGAGILESSALLAFLPAACERLLGETLKLASIATWWCGESAALDDVLPRLHTSVIKSAFPRASFQPLFADGLDEAGRAAWTERLRATPEEFVVEEYVPLSHAPSWEQGHVGGRALMLRVFLAHDGHGDYRVMPGGLARIAGGERQIVSSQRGGRSKDTWVLSDAPVPRFSLLRGRLRPEDIARSERIVSSRSAEHLFWMGRYAERSENCARLLRAVLTRLPYAEALPLAMAQPIVRTCVRQGLLDPDDGWGSVDVEGGSSDALERALVRGLVDEKTHSVAFNIMHTVRAASAVRDRLSSDNWRLLSRLAEDVADAPQGALAETLEYLDRVIVALVAVGGLETAHMTRDDGWRFLSLGRHLERLQYIATTVRDVAESGLVEDALLLEWLLDLSDSLITYRARYMRHPEWLAVAHLLTADQRNPRAAAFQLARLAKHAKALPGGGMTEMAAALRRSADACETRDVLQGELFGGTHSLDAVLEEADSLALALSNELTLRFFSHVYETSRSTSIL
jgi:uncharacterized circularly permuted ATP-grasp superfamily protein/uncharacterized alpha-E superfamily protein